VGGWCFQVFGEQFKDCGEAFAIGEQDDGYSCGICVINAMESAILGTPLFTHEARYRLRVQCFVTIVRYLVEHVRGWFPNSRETQPD
jgi:hypothetical protein